MRTRNPFIKLEGFYSTTTVGSVSFVNGTICADFQKCIEFSKPYKNDCEKLARCL